MDSFTVSSLQASLGTTKSITGSVARSELSSEANKIEGAGSQSFSEVLVGKTESMVASLQKAEATAAAGMKGDATAYQVATDVMDAQQQLRMAVSIRDKFIQSYLEIARMQI